MNLKNTTIEHVPLAYAASTKRYSKQPCPGCQKAGGERLPITGKGRLAAGPWHYACVYAHLQPWIEGTQAQLGGFNPHGALVNIENWLARQKGDQHYVDQAILQK